MQAIPMETLTNTDFNKLDSIDQCNYAYSILYTKNKDFILATIPKLPHVMIQFIFDFLEDNLDIVNFKHIRIIYVDVECSCEATCPCECNCDTDRPLNQLFNRELAEDIYLQILQMIDVTPHLKDRWYPHSFNEYLMEWCGYPKVDKYIFNKLLQHDNLLIEYAQRRLVGRMGTGIVCIPDQKLILYSKYLISKIVQTELLSMSEFENIIDLIFKI